MEEHDGNAHSSLPRDGHESRRLGLGKLTRLVRLVVDEGWVTGYWVLGTGYWVGVYGVPSLRGIRFL